MLESALHTGRTLGTAMSKGTVGSRTSCKRPCDEDRQTPISKASLLKSDGLHRKG